MNSHEPLFHAIPDSLYSQKDIQKKINYLNLKINLADVKVSHIAKATGTDFEKVNLKSVEDIDMVSGLRAGFQYERIEAGKKSIALHAKDGSIWMNQSQLAELFATSKQNIGQHVSNILEEKELSSNSVVKNYFTTASDGKEYKVTFYSKDVQKKSKHLNLTINLAEVKVSCLAKATGTDFEKVNLKSGHLSKPVEDICVVSGLRACLQYESMEVGKKSFASTNAKHRIYSGLFY